jgi:hypothetical protein
MFKQLGCGNPFSIYEYNMDLQDKKNTFSLSYKLHFLLIPDNMNFSIMIQKNSGQFTYSIQTRLHSTLGMNNHAAELPLYPLLLLQSTHL